MKQAPTEACPSFGVANRKVWWLLCALPALAVITLEETPGLSGLDGINAAGLIVFSPVFIGAGFGLTAVVVMLTRWIGQRVRLHSRMARAGLMLTIVALLSPLAYLDSDWLLLSVIELASLPAALILTVPVEKSGMPPSP